MHRSRTFNAILGVAGLISSGLVLAPSSAHAVRPIDSAGAVEVWGHDTVTASPFRATYDAAGGPYTAVAVGASGGSFAINSDGFIRRLSGTAPALDIPAGLTDTPVKALAVAQSKAAAVKSDGSVQVWGDSRGIGPQTLSVATLGAKAVDVAMASALLVVLLEDGRVGMLTAGFGYEIVKLEPGVDLQQAVQIEVNQDNTGFARLDGGGVFGWSIAGPYTGYPVDVAGDDLADPVLDFAVNGVGAVAVTEAGEVHTWNTINGEPLTDEAQFPASTVSDEVVDVATTSSYFGARTNSGDIVVWGQNSQLPEYSSFTTVPEEAEGENLVALEGGAQAFAAIVAPPASEVTVATPAALAAPEPRVYDTLTGTPATFNGSPSPVVTNRWLANDEPIAGATGTTLTLTDSLRDKSIKFQTIATRGEETPVVSTSSAVGPVGPANPIASVTSLTSPARFYGQSGTATVSVTNAGSRPVAGTVTLKGAGPTQTKTLVNGKAAFTLPKSLTPKAYTLTASYSGSSVLNASTRTSRYTVARARSKAPTFKTTKTPTSKKSGKATVTVATVSGLARATGKVTVTLKKGSSTKRVSATLSGGKRNITLPKLKKGTWKVTVSYPGDKNYVAQKSKTYSLKVKK